VLGTVQGSALRFDRARARPAGLDGACAQTAVLAITRWPTIYDAQGLNWKAHSLTQMPGDGSGFIGTVAA
jgi:hypothetical protein